MKAAIVPLALAVPCALGGLSSCLTSGDVPSVDAGGYGFDVSVVDSTVDFDAKGATDSTTAADTAMAIDSTTQVDSAVGSDAAGEVDSGVDAADAGEDGAVLVDSGGAEDSGVEAGDAAIPFCEGVCGTPGCGGCPDAATAGTYDRFQDASFNLDTVEVTNARYAAFLAANLDPATQPVFCAWNASFVPSAGWPASGNGSDPVAYVDWCDAYAYCAWAGRRLCGNIGGGPTASAYTDNGDQSQWFLGCTNGQGGSGESGYVTYPYGDTYDASTCNGADYDAGGVIPVGSDTRCVGGLAGLFDMSGNVREWEDACWDLDQSDAGPEAGPGSVCAERGGGFQDDAGGLGCAVAVYEARAASRGSVGFRCCSR